MKIIKCAIVFGVLFFGANVNMIAQEKGKTVVKQGLKGNSDEDEVIKKLNHKMENATPEEREEILKKIEAYKAEKNSHGNAFGKNKEGLEGKEFGENRAIEAKEKINQAYLEVEESNARIEIASSRIKAAEEELYKAEKNKTLSEDEIAIRKEKLAKAKKELHETEVALKKQKETVDAKHAEVIKEKQ